MAKKSDRGRPKGVPLEQVIAVKGTPKWRRWLEGLANKLGLSSSETIDEALRDKAKSVGYEPPPNRTGDSE